MNKGKLFIISGPSGSGKDTILGEVFKTHPEIMLSISSITRPMRPGETEGEKYHFISVPEFKAMIENDALLEYNEFCGNFYGTPKAPVENWLNEGKDVILEIDVNGAEKIRAKMPDAVSVFIMPPSFEILRQRLTGRGTDAPEVIEKRLKTAIAEIKAAKDYDYIVVNDVLCDAVNDFISVILSERLKIERKKYIIDEVLEKC